MKFDIVIIGGGLAGLVCGISLAKRGQRCAIISSGQSALHFSSGSLDLLSQLPDGSAVECPVKGVEELVRQSKEHPYAKLGAERFVELAEQSKEILQWAGVDTVGDSERNHYRLSPVGVLKPTWLTFRGYVNSEKATALKWKRVALFNAEGFLDFYPQFLRDELRAMGTICEVHTFNLPELEQIRQNPTEMRSANVARLFDSDEAIDALAEIIRSQKGDVEAVLLPAVLGVDCNDGVKRLEERLGCEVAVVATLPPSVPGLQVQTLLRRYFQELGGVYLPGDTVVGYKAEGDHIEAVYTSNHGDIGFRADNFVLATGSFFSGGLEADNEKVVEPLFGVDVAYAENRQAWYERDLFQTQGYESFGVRCDENFNALRAGRKVDNLYAIGACLAGFNGIKDGCGAGVSMLSALHVSDVIIKKK